MSAQDVRSNQDRPSRLLSSQGAAQPAAPTVAPPALLSADDARAQGHEAARAELQHAFEQRLHDMEAANRIVEESLRSREAALTTALAALADAQRGLAANAEATLARLTALAAGRLLCTLAEQKLLATEAARAVLVQYAELPGLQLAMNTAEHGMVVAQIPDAKVLITDPTLKPGEYRIRLPHRELDMRIAREYLALCELMQDDGTVAG